jgi:hypothetical protein
VQQASLHYENDHEEACNMHDGFRAAVAAKGLHGLRSANEKRQARPPPFACLFNAGLMPGIRSSAIRDAQ